MAAAANADPEVDLLLLEGDGSDDLANLNASVPGVKLKLGAMHWLREASGGDDWVLWSQLEMMVSSAVYFDAEALDAVSVIGAALSPAAMAGVARAALNAGMERASKGSMSAALYYFASFVRSKRAASPSLYTIDDPTQFSRVDATQPFQGAENGWLFDLTIPMCIDDDGDGVVLASFQEVFPGKFTATSRADEDFKACAVELYQITKEATSGFTSLTGKRKAMTVAITIGSKAPDAALLVPIQVKKALYAAMRYRREPAKALNQRFLQAWTLAFPNLLELFTNKCSPREAWSHAERLLGQEPSFVLLQALDARIPKLISAIDADADLASPSCGIGARVAEMERLL